MKFPLSDRTSILHLSHVHRGGGKAERPDNTLETFRWCWENGSALECDCRRTRDGVGIMLHDETLRRTARGIPDALADKPVSTELDWNEIKDIDVGSYLSPDFAHHRIPRIEDVFREMRRDPKWLCFVDEKGAGPGYIADKAREAGVTILTRLIVREDAQELYGFATREERALFDQLRAISGVGPKLALAVLSTFTPAQLATVVVTQDAGRMAQVPGVGKKKASRLLVELSDVFSKNIELKQLVGLTDALPAPKEAVRDVPAQEAADALLSMGFTSAEVALALEGAAEAGIASTKDMLSYALRRLGGGR